ncbi:hypothetical protein Tco_0808743 [Tanacetum coccineum]
MSLEEAKKESTKSDYDDEADVTGSMVKSSKVKNLKKFDFVTKDGRQIHLSKEQINNQKKLEEEAKAKAAKQEGEVREAELIDLLSLEVVHKYYNYKLQYDRYCEKMLNRRPESRITNCDILTRKGPITFKVYKEDGTYEVIPNFKVSDLHLGEWREVMKACPDKTGKGWQTIYDQIQTRMDYLHTTEVELGINLDIPLTTKRLKSSVKYGDYLPDCVLNEPILGLGVDDHARTFSSLLLAEVDKINLNPLKPMRTIEQLRQNRTTYTAYSDPQGVIYKDQNNRNRLMRTNELHKFSDSMLNDVRTALYDIASGVRMQYLPKRKWSGFEKRRSHVFIQDIDKQLFQKRLMRNLEKFVGGREYGEDLRLLTRTI